VRAKRSEAIRAVSTFDRQKPGRVPRKKSIGSRITTRSDKLSKAPNTCVREVEFIADYLSTRLDLKEQAAFESHLEACSDCVAFLQTYKKTIELTRTFLFSAGQTCRPRQSLLRPTPRPTRS